ncbi:MAG: MotA/TolQ/ExbB proton channel family protein [Pirellulales bacterium]
MRKTLEFIRPAQGSLRRTVFFVSTLTMVALFDGGPAFAQDTNPDEEVTVGETAEVAAPPVSHAPSDAGTAPAPRRSYLGWLYDSLGPMYSIVFLSLSFALVAVFVMNVLMARRDTILPRHLIDGFEAHLNAKKYQEAYELAKSDESFLGKVLSAGLARLSSGYPQAIEAMQEVGEEENMRLEHRLSYLALIGTISPMFGLLGTVQGMVAAFEEIARSSVSPKPSELAGGISMALVTTLVGLWLAIPAVAAFNILRNRFARLVLEVGIVSENLMSRFQNVGTQKPPIGN